MRRLYFRISGPDQGARIAIQRCDVGLGTVDTALEDEAAKASASLKTYARIEYPVQAAAYKIHWEMMVPTDQIVIVAGDRPRWTAAERAAKLHGVLLASRKRIRLGDEENREQ